MKVPDKIYLERDKETDKIHHLWGQSSVIHSGYEHIEYIRKDTLLEWLENKVSLSYGVATDALVEVIDKLNSL